MKLPNGVFRRSRVKVSARRHRSVDLILFVFMVLVFGPVIGLHVGYAVLSENAVQTGAPIPGSTKASIETMVAARRE